MLIDNSYYEKNLLFNLCSYGKSPLLHGPIGYVFFSFSFSGQSNDTDIIFILYNINYFHLSYIECRYYL